MASKMVTDRQKTAGALSAALKKHSEEASDRFARLIRPFLVEGEPLPDTNLLQEVLSRRLASFEARLVTADEAHQRELGDDGPAREKRDASAREVANVMSQIRRLVDGAYGSGSCMSLLGIGGTLPRDSMTLLRLGKRAIERMGEEEFALPKALLGGVSLDSGPWLDKLRGPVQELEEAVIALYGENRDAVRTQLVKNEAIEDYDRAYLATARLLEAFFNYCSLTELANRVRPTKRGGVTSSGEGDEQPSAPSAPPSGPPAVNEDTTVAELPGVAVNPV